MNPRPQRYIIAVPAILFGAFLAFDVLPWIVRRRYLSPLVAGLSVATATLWLISLWWSLHNFWLRFLSLLAIPERGGFTAGKPAKHIFILYVVRDDFVPDSLISCLRQGMSPDGFSVIVCDDSQRTATKDAIDLFCREHCQTRLIRRSTCSGFKAGNLTHAFRILEPHDDDWMVIVDADDLLPPDFLKRLSSFVPEVPAQIGFLQGDLLPAEDMAVLPRGLPTRTSPFRRFVQSELRMKSGHDMPWREYSGFFCFLGHGGAIRGRCWRQLGGFPECVSEDMAFTIRANEAFIKGSRFPGVAAFEPSPGDFASYLVRCRRHAAGAAEVVTNFLPAFLNAPVG